MKKMKKIVALLLAAVMVLGMSMTVFADEPATQVTTGSISIHDAVTGQEYKAYLMFELEEYDTTTGAYLYTITDAWKEFVEEDTVGAYYFEIYDDDHVRKDSNFPADPEYSEADLAKAAVAYAAENNITPAATLPKTENGTTSYTASGLTLGYYAVDSSMGALCALTTLDPNSQVKEKNLIPKVEKQVLEDVDQDGEVDDTDTWGKENNASIGDVVFFKTKISAKAGAHNYVLHDRMGVGLDVVKTGENAIKVTVDGVTLDAINYEIAYDVVNAGDADVVCDFEITFSNEYLATITKDTEIVVTYAAILNKDALIYSEANRNATYLKYGDGTETEWDFTYTYTYMFDLVKTDSSNKVLSGAKFELYKRNANGARGEKIKLKDMGNGSYHVATDEEIASGTDATIVAGNVVIKGLDAGKYNLVETVAPTGYNKLTEDIEFEIKDGNLKATFENSLYKDGGVHIVNETGSILPETGGIGTTIFYVAGGALVLAAVVVLVSKKRMSVEE